MRLGQLARKLAVRPSQIVVFLSTKQIYLEEGSNARLEDTHVSTIVNYFAPERLNEILKISIEAAAPIVESSAVVEVVEVKELIEQTPVPELAINFEEEKIEVIKAPKVELTGLKVLGKIDLPEPKKKETIELDKPDGEQATEEKVRPRPSTKRSNTNSRDRQPSEKPWKNPIALQREREAREADEKRRESLEREKEKRRQHYLGKVKTGQPTKATRLYDEQAEEAPVIKSAPPKTLWGKFMKWLNN